MIHFFLDTYDLFSPVPIRESLVIDNTNLPAIETAERIIAHFQLQPGDLTKTE